MEGFQKDEKYPCKCRPGITNDPKGRDFRAEVPLFGRALVIRPAPNPSKHGRGKDKPYGRSRDMQPAPFCK